MKSGFENGMKVMKEKKVETKALEENLKKDVGSHALKCPQQQRK